MENIFETFQKPPMQYRGVPFWAWNSALKGEELVRQIRIMKEMGFGGFFMHSRVGMNTPYLSEEWFQCIRTCAEEAEKLGMKAWLYDEDRWPSGAAGGFVTKDPKYRQRYLACEEADADAKAEPGDVWFVLTYQKDAVCKYERIAKPSLYRKSPDTALFRFRLQVVAPTSWFNDTAYLDTLNPEAVQKFIEVTHEAYKKRFSEKFGNVIPGIFSDEPNYSHVIPDYGVPWTDALPEKFRKAYGYDILDHLPELFFDCGKKISYVRWNFRDLLSNLFVNNFARQIGEWCSKNNLLMTGHIFDEDCLNWQTRSSGSVMRCYEYMQMPGIDLLTEYWQTFNTMKQLSSSARQCGIPRRLTETYGCTGWDFPFMGHKALGDWQYALGINFRCQHLAWYSMEAEAKRDYPASISFQSSWYKKYGTVEDYFARLSTVMTGGKEIRDVLVIHPIESYWTMFYTSNKSSDLTEMDRAFTELTTILLGDNIDFDFGDEHMLARLGKVEGTTFKVGEADYRAILIPELKSIRTTTLKLLKQFADNGGTVVYLGSVPEYADARPSKEVAEIYRAFEHAEINWPGEKLLKDGRRLSVTDPSGSQIKPVLSRLAEKDGAFNLFLCNTGMNFCNTWGDCRQMVRDRIQAFPKTEIRVELPDNGDVYELDALTGKIYQIPFRREDGCYVFSAGFAPLQSHLYLFTKERPAQLTARPEFHTELPPAAFPEKNWIYALSDHNSLVLDHFTLKANGKTELENAYFLDADIRLRDLLHAPHRGDAMVQPWVRDKSVPEKKLDIELVYSFNCETVPADTCLLALERPELYSRILLNGTELKNQPSGWWVDPVLQTLEIPLSLLKKGGNTLQLFGKYHEKLPGLETIFLLGNFGVTDEKITALPERLNVGDWCGQGLMEYSGDVLYSQTADVTLNPGEHVFLRIPGWRGAAIGVSVNGSPEEMVFLPPFELDVTEHLRSGSNQFTIRIYGSRRNAFGPFFAGQKWQRWVGSGAFIKVSEERSLVPGGMLTAPELFIRK